MVSKRPLARALRMDFLNLVRDFASLLDSEDRRRLFGLAVLSCAVAVLQALSIIVIVGFLGLALKPELIEDVEFLSAAGALLGLTNRRDIIVAVGVGAAFLAITAQAATISFHYLRATWAEFATLEISQKLLRNYLERDYPFFLTCHSADIQHLALNETMQLSRNVIKPLLELGAAVTVVIAMVSMMMLIKPIETAAISAFLLSIYGLIFVVLKGPIARLGDQRVKQTQRRYKLSAEILAGIKEIKLRGLEEKSLRETAGPGATVARAIGSLASFQPLPRAVVEALIFGFAIAAIAVIVVSGGSLDEHLPIFALFALGGYRLLPAVQAIYQSATLMTSFGQSVLDLITTELSQRQWRSTAAHHTTTQVQPIALNQQLEIRGLSYKYPTANQLTLQNINLVIKKNEFVGIIGKSGAGKSTFIDVFLGLLPPDEGEIILDGQTLSRRQIANLQRSIGYVAQSPFLIDGTIAENIAFGIDEPDLDRVREAAAEAAIDDFIQGDLPDGYETKVGQDGGRLSGGQRQRIAIARALYNRPNILLFDEATGALDGDTEVRVMESIHRLAGRRTILMVSHRLSCLTECDKVVTLDAGRLVKSGGLEYAAKIS